MSPEVKYGTIEDLLKEYPTTKVLIPLGGVPIEEPKNETKGVQHLCAQGDSCDVPICEYAINPEELSCYEPKKGGKK